MNIPRAPRAVVFVFMGWLASDVVHGQSSSNFTIRSSTVNAGGNPQGGVVPQSANHKIPVDAIGDAIVRDVSSSANYVLLGGSAGEYPSPGEVLGLRFSSTTGLIWNVEPSAGLYNLYRGPIPGIPGSGFGGCSQQSISGAGAIDASVPAPVSGFFYLVTVKTVLEVEGTKGRTSAGVERPNLAPCP